MRLIVRRGIWHRTVFIIAATSLGYTAASYAFRLAPASFADGHIGPGPRAFTWALGVAACELIAGMTRRLLILASVKIADRRVRLWKVECDAEALQGIFVEIDLGVLITLAVALSPALVLLAVPTVLLARRFLVHPLLVAQSRVDAKTGLLNASTWEKEAEAEMSRAVRTGSAVSLALVDIDHFKAVNDTHGHLVGDRALKAVADALTSQLRDCDRAGRFGGEEFVLLLSRAAQDEACRIAERLRRYICQMAVPVSDSPGAACVRLSVSIGVTAMEAGRRRELRDMLAAADSALYEAKQAGRNKVATARRDTAAEFRVTFQARPVEPVSEPVRIDPAGASLGSAALRSVPAGPRRDCAAGRGSGNSGPAAGDGLLGFGVVRARRPDRLGDPRDRGLHVGHGGDPGQVGVGEGLLGGTVPLGEVRRQVRLKLFEFTGQCTVGALEIRLALL
jgi:diguanylate cyclase (GGDEF)-like protein